MFRSLALFNYRVWFIGALVSNIGHWLQVTALSWIVLTQLKGGGAVAMGVTMALQFVPPLLLVGIAGTVVDHVDRRRLLFVTQWIRGIIALTLGVMMLTDLITLPAVFAFALAQGITAAFDNTARQTFVSDLVPPGHTSNAVALNAASFNVARFIGPAVAGVLIVAIGGGWMFILNALTFAATLAALALLRPAEFTPRPNSTRPRRLLEGFTYVRTRPDIVMLIVLTSVVGTFGMNFPIVASTMTVAFGRDADSFGLLISIFAIGSVMGALLSARRPQPRMRFAIGATLVFAIASAASAYAPTLWSYAGISAIVGMATVTILTTANGYIQTTSDPMLRGRVMAIYQAVNMSGTAAGALVYGTLAEHFGPRAALMATAVIAGLACAASVSRHLLARRRSHTSRQGSFVGASE